MSEGDIVLYSAPDGAQVQLRASGGTVWLTQAEMASLYGTSVPNIAQVISRVLADDEVGEATINSELMVRQEGSRTVLVSSPATSSRRYRTRCSGPLLDIRLLKLSSSGATQRPATWV